MGFRTGSWCTIWEVEPVSDTLTKGRVSISRKNKQTNQYETDFNGFVSFIGTTAAKKAASLKEKDKIKLGDVDVSNKYDAGKRVTYTNFKIFSFDLPEDEHNEPSPVRSTPEPIDNGEADSDLPF